MFSFSTKSTTNKRYICFLTKNNNIYYIDTNFSRECNQLRSIRSLEGVADFISKIQLSEEYYITDLSGEINLFYLIADEVLIAMFFIEQIGDFKKEIDSTHIISNINVKTILKNSKLTLIPIQIIRKSKTDILISQGKSVAIDKQIKAIDKAIELRNKRLHIDNAKRWSKINEEQNEFVQRKGGNKYDKYTLNELKQIALDNKIKITKMVVIGNDELHKKLKDKNIIINKKIKLEDFKRILKENNIKITKKVNLTKQELIKKLKNDIRFH
jgi:hypothetical protein